MTKNLLALKAIDFELAEKAQDWIFLSVKGDSYFEVAIACASR